MKARAVWNDAFLVCHEIYQAARELVNSRVPTTQLTSASKFLWRPDLRPRLVEYVADFARCGGRALGESPAALPRRSDVVEPKKAVDITAFFRPKKVPRASRLILFRMYYLGGAEYEAARHLLGLSERTWSDWAEEIRQRVGSELIRAGMYPPARYFREAAIRDAAPAASVASTKNAPEEKIQRVPCEPDLV
jgi:hypothetical protein